MAVVKQSSAEVKARPRVLVVDDEPTLVELVSDVVRSMDCRIFTASTIAEAKKILAVQEVEVLVTDVNLPDGDGVGLLATLHRRQPSASAIVITGSPKLDTAITALREGAVDFIPKPFNKAQLVEHVAKAIEAQARAAKGERKLQRLRLAVKRLNEARKLISKKVDLLCNDLVSAYGELSRQLDDVRTKEGFRKYIANSNDLEQLLCHAMDWLLRQVGFSNVALWLAGEDGEFQLGAYMKYTVAGDDALTSAMRKVILPLAERDGRDTVIHLKADDLRDRLPAEAWQLLKGQDLLTISCTYLGEPLAALILFREESNPFTLEDQNLLKAIAPVFAVSLASVVRDGVVDEDGESMEESEAGEDGEDGGLKDGPEPGSQKQKRSRRPDPADWWKRGESPPF